MKVSEISDFDNYWKNPRFARKKAVVNGSLVQRYGDNIYHRNKRTNHWIQEHSFHSKEGGVLDPDNLSLDTSTSDRVLIGEWFIYWGGEGPEIPKYFDSFVHKGIGHHCIDDVQLIDEFFAWATSQGERGVRGDPCEWKYPRRKRKASKSEPGASRAAA
jgi:hypothetical protein